MSGGYELETEVTDAAYLKELYVVHDPADRVVPSQELLDAIQKLTGPTKALIERVITAGFSAVIQK